MDELKFIYLWKDWCYVYFDLSESMILLKFI